MSYIVPMIDRRSLAHIRNVEVNEVNAFQAVAQALRIAQCDDVKAFSDRGKVFYLPKE